MKNMKKFMAVMAVASLVATSTITVSAFNYEGPQGEADTSTDLGKEAEANGHTTFAVVEAKAGEDPENVSFTVPLYVTMAVLDGETDLVTPSNYEIRNASQPSADALAADADAVGYSISVIGMNFEKLADSTYNTVSDLTGKTNKDMLFTIGGLAMPALSVATAVDVILSATAGTAFYDAGAFAKIEPNGVLPLEIEATLGAPAVVANNTPAAAQFKVKYTVGAVVKDASGADMILAVYAGDDSVAAGLGKYNISEGKFEPVVVPTP